jgi:hypothetical protein
MQVNYEVILTIGRVVGLGTRGSAKVCVDRVVRDSGVDMARGVSSSQANWMEVVCAVLADVVFNSHALFGCSAFVVRVRACR